MAEIFNKEALEALDEHGEAEEMARVASPKLRLGSKRPITLEIEKPGEYQIMYPDGPINIYGIRFLEKKAEPAAEPAAK